MLDIHTHLYFLDYDADREEVIRRAFDAGLTMIISVSTAPEDHRKALEISTLDERIFASVGLHPHTFNDHFEDAEWQVKAMQELRDLVKNNSKIIAIGECGLDYFSHTDDPVTDEQKSWQKEGFVSQIKLAQELELPMIIHCRDAYEDLLEIVRQHGADTKFIMHCYMGDTEVTRKFLELPNVYFSFTGNITYPVKKALEGTEKDIRETVKLVPIERMFMETDCPFLAPVPYRGKRNEPSYVVEVAKKIAEIQGHSMEDIALKMEENKQMFFRA